MQATFTAGLWRWPGDSGWHFISLPPEVADLVDEAAPPTPTGFGSVRVSVRIGTSSWQTSVFPSREHETYLLPVKKPVRTAQELVEGDLVEVHLSVAE